MVPVRGPGNTRRRSLAASSAAVVLIGALAAAGAASRGVPAGRVSLADIAARTSAFFMNVLKPDQPYSPGECQSQFEINCYTPAQIQQAYSLPSLYRAGITGKGTTVVVVDAYGSPTLAADLREFDSEADLPGATLKILRPLGRIPLYDQSSTTRVGWAGETTLDVEWVHAIAPGAAIDVVEVPKESVADLTGGVWYAIRHRLGYVISQSWGGAEQDLGSRALLYLHDKIYAESVRNRITVVASTGDTGVTEPTSSGYYDHPETQYPATDPDVVAVGGTKLDLGPGGGKLAADTVWNDTYSQAVNVGFNQSTVPNPIATGGGYSTVFVRPSYQRGVRNVVGRWRGIPDISMSASCADSVQVYQSFPPEPAGWNPVCGTSESAPMFAGIVALADQKAGRSLGFINPVLYQLAARHATGIVLVTSGNNTVAYSSDSLGATVSPAVTVHGYHARHGYSLAAGLGTVNARYFVPELVSPGLVKPPGHPKKPAKDKHTKKRHA